MAGTYQSKNITRVDAEPKDERRWEMKWTVDGARWAVRAMLFVFLIGLASCQRREITYFMEAEVSITADWSEANLEYENNYGATAVFYPKAGGEPKILLLGDRTQGKVRLPKGHYSVVVFNRSFNDFSGLAFKGTDSYNTLEAYTVQVESRVVTKAGDTEDVIVNSPEKLAADAIEEFEVTEEMLGNYSKTPLTRGCTQEGCSLHFKPMELTKTVKVKVNVKGLHNVKQAHCTLSGVPTSVFLASGRTGEQTVIQEFAMENPVFNQDSYTEGSITGTLNVFGFDKELPHDLNLKANLVDGKTTVEQAFKEVDASENEDETGVISLYINAQTKDPIPDVKPEDGADSGFDAEVGGWGEEINSDIKI